MKRGEAILLSLILALALALRVWSINWGMPYALHADEDNYLPGAVGMLMKGDWNRTCRLAVGTTEHENGEPAGDRVRGSLVPRARLGT